MVSPHKSKAGSPGRPFSDFPKGFLPPDFLYVSRFAVGQIELARKKLLAQGSLLEGLLEKSEETAPVAERGG